MKRCCAALNSFQVNCAKSSRDFSKDKKNNHLCWSKIEINMLSVWKVCFQHKGLSGFGSSFELGWYCNELWIAASRHLLLHCVHEVSPGVWVGPGGHHPSVSKDSASVTTQALENLPVHHNSFEVLLTEEKAQLTPRAVGSLVHPRGPGFGLWRCRPD